MIIVARHECTTPVYFVHPINFATSGINIPHVALLFFIFFWSRTSMNLIRLLGARCLVCGRGAETVESHSKRPRAAANIARASSLICIGGTALMMRSLNKVVEFAEIRRTFLHFMEFINADSHVWHVYFTTRKSWLFQHSDKCCCC